MQVDEEVAHGLAGIRRLVQTLQDQVDSSGAAPAADASSVPSSARKVSSNAQAFVLESIQKLSREVAAAKAAWALANLAANNKDNQDAIRWGSRGPCVQGILLGCQVLNRNFLSFGLPEVFRSVAFLILLEFVMCSLLLNTAWVD